MIHRTPVITRSNEIYERAKKVVPAGSQTFSKGVTQFVEGFAPKYLHRGKGSRVWDVDGNDYLDYIMACHPIILGYADPDVNAAVMEQLELGSTFSLMNELEVDVTEQLIDAIPCAEAARFGKNGADATTVAVRVARAVTGREHVAYCGYHGWHDWYIANTDLNSGIPEFAKQLSHSFNYNDLDSLEAIFKAHPGQVACVIMEPLTILEPKDNFLHEVKKMAHHYGALLIFDEIITGFRFHFGGAQALTGVTPDLATFAKAISNAIPLSAIVGKKEYMFALEKTFFSFTYGGDCIGLAAAKACIPKLKREKVPDHLWTVGTRLKDGYNALVASHGLEEFTSCIGYPCRTIISFTGQGRYDELEMKSYFQQEMIRRGILWTAYHALCWSHSMDDIEYTLEAYDEVLGLFRKVVDSGQSLRPLIEGEPVKPVFRKVADFNSYVTKKRG
ncbi:glutamate-1-semialdehyde aminotransferase [Paramagnetospirillum caucaseum]|uniref:Glutamate-1-semialdehyde aminotransferase n=1 Tax=Paramagnetospirillum caucaseum TaxID=1244869 RepID=M2Y8E8_9PROT|nr:aminotransferase class III-fold pyridoxal phosphate-dependent enzyme [Paramagnetospirillum caucaseum]EME69326.1 glutamate-1-semialdehyde aminotransferase [Paramagnetospirillum caucaseum]